MDEMAGPKVYSEVPLHVIHYIAIAIRVHDSTIILWADPGFKPDS